MFLKLVTILACLYAVLGSRLDFFRSDGLDMSFSDSDDDESSDDDSSEDSYDYGVNQFYAAKKNKAYTTKRARSCGYSPLLNRGFSRITDGVEAVPHSHPWQVSILTRRGDKYSHFCGGTIIGPNKVLTAAHCIFTKNNTRRPNSDLYVAAGLHHMKQVKNLVQKVIDSKVNSDYDSDESFNDIAILYTELGFRYNPSIQPACLPTSEAPLGSNCYTSGWGDMWFGQNTANEKLFEVKLPILSFDKCRRLIGTSYTKSMICAGYEGGDKSPCNGDSGGPLICYRDKGWTVEGVASYIPEGCGLPGKPAVFTKVYSYMDWINSI